MIEEFASFLKSNNLIQASDTLLVAVSGGADSVVLTHLLEESAIDFAIAHCNFTLRAEDSDADERYVRNLASKYNCTLYCKRFDTALFAHENKVSIEMAARTLRYDWFAEIMATQEYSLLATAHHQDDNAETMLLNLIRGTGLKGLTGIKPRSGNIIRPLLFASKEQILQYASIKGITYRTDLSNNENVYKRNKVRNVIIPQLKEMNPSIISTFHENIYRLNQVNEFVQDKIAEILQQLVEESSDDVQKVCIERLSEQKHIQLILHEWLSQYGFSPETISDISLSLYKQSGKIFYSASHLLVKDREHLILTHLKVSVSGVYVNETDREVFSNCHLTIEFIDVDAHRIEIDPNPRMAFIDVDTILFPLKLRLWEEGDAFVPLGMTSKKKISDYLIDKKVSLVEKRSTSVLLSGDNVIWLVGHRISNDVKITTNTRRVMKISCC